MVGENPWNSLWFLSFVFSYWDLRSRLTFRSIPRGAHGIAQPPLPVWKLSDTDQDLLKTGGRRTGVHSSLWNYICCVNIYIFDLNNPTDEGIDWSWINFWMTHFRCNFKDRLPSRGPPIYLSANVKGRWTRWRWCRRGGVGPAGMKQWHCQWPSEGMILQSI